MTEVSSKINVYPCNKHVKRNESSYWFAKLKYVQTVQTMESLKPISKVFLKKMNKLFDPKNLSPPLGYPQWAKIKKMFSFLASEWFNSWKKAKIFFWSFWPKIILSPSLGWPPMGKNKNFFFSFLASEWLNSRKKAKKKLTQNLVLECVECGPLEGQDEFLGRSVIHRWNRTAKGYLLRKNDQNS